MNLYIIDDNPQKALKKAIDVAKKEALKNDKKITIAVEEDEDFDGIISKILNENIIKNFKLRQKSILNENINFYSISSKNFIEVNGIIVASFITIQLLDKILNKFPENKIIYVPWLPKEIEYIKKLKDFKEIK